jgi:cation diffusion facilitator family transporter
VERPINTRQQVQRVLFIILVLNLVVAFCKILLGLASGVLSITADGFHSIVDGSSNVVGLVATRLAARPPDADHPYGHRRYETIASLGIGLLLLVTAWEIVSSALSRLNGSEGQTEHIPPLAFAVMLATLVVNLFVTRYERRKGQQLQSELLVADAAHTGTDVYVTVSVLVSMAIVALTGWGWVDTAAALVITAIILRTAWQVLRQTGGVLVDTAPYSAEQLTAWVRDVPAVEQVVRARSRGPIDAVQVDIDVQVAPETTADHTAAIAEAIRDRLQQQVNGISEVEVHFVPAQNGDRDYALLARARADALGLSTHEVRVIPGRNGNVLEMHVEVPPGETLSAAHERVSQLEQRVRGELPDVADVITHIEPAVYEEPPPPERPGAESIQRRALELLQARYPDADWHHLLVTPFDEGFALTMHVALQPDITVEEAHRTAEAAETLLRIAIPSLERVTIHTEPQDQRDTP